MNSIQRLNQDELIPSQQNELFPTTTQERFQQIQGLLSAREGVSLAIQSVFGELAPFLQRIIELESVKPINPIIFAPQIQVKVNSDNIITTNSNNLTNSNNIVDSYNPRTTTTNNRIDVRQKNCGNRTLHFTEDNSVRDSGNYWHHEEVNQEFTYLMQDCLNDNRGANLSPSKKKMFLKG